MLRYRSKCLASLLIFFVLTFLAQWGQARETKFKVLVVMSYSTAFSWEIEIRKGIESVLAKSCRLNYFYLNTKDNFAGGPEKAKEAYAFYRKYHPDGVIAADDDAQAMFVVPYLKDKVTTPVMFCGVNSEPDAYGYPAKNVSGILERLHMRESIALAQQLVPSIRTVAYMVKKSPVAELMFTQFRKEEKSYGARSVAYKMPETMPEALKMAKELKTQADLLFVTTLQGIPSKNGTPLTDPESIPLVVKAFGKPTITDNTQNVYSGVLCAVVKTGQEQGATAAEMLLKAMQGTPVAQIPIVRNYNGKRIINVTTLNALGIKPKSIDLLGIQLVKTSKQP